MKPTDLTRSALAACLSALCALSFTSCATTDSTNTGKKPLPASQTIHWPAEYRPEKATFYVHNEIEIAAPPQVVWDLLMQAEDWPAWYPGARNVKIQQPSGTRLRSGGIFTWNTMDFDFESRIKEFAPPYRLSWESRRSSIRGYHAWLIIPTEQGCRVVTDESQFGVLAVLQKVFLPNKLRRLHDVWLAELKKKAEAKSALTAAR